MAWMHGCRKFPGRSHPSGPWILPDSLSRRGFCGAVALKEKRRAKGALACFRLAQHRLISPPISAAI